MRFVGQSQRYIVHERAAVNSTVPGDPIVVIDTDLQVGSLQFVTDFRIELFDFYYRY